MVLLHLLYHSFPKNQVKPLDLFSFLKAVFVSFVAFVQAQLPAFTPNNFKNNLLSLNLIKIVQAINNLIWAIGKQSYRVFRFLV